MNIALRLKNLRESHGWSQNKLAQLSGLSQGFVRQIELEEKQPTVDSVSKLCTALGITLADFFAEEKEELEPELLRLLDTAKKLTPEQRELAQRLLEAMNKD